MCRGIQITGVLSLQVQLSSFIKTPIAESQSQESEIADVDVVISVGGCGLSSPDGQVEIPHSIVLSWPSIVSTRGTHENEWQ